MKIIALTFILQNETRTTIQMIWMTTMTVTLRIYISYFIDCVIAVITTKTITSDPSRKLSLPPDVYITKATRYPLIHTFPSVCISMPKRYVVWHDSYCYQWPIAKKVALNIAQLTERTLRGQGIYTKVNCWSWSVAGVAKAVGRLNINLYYLGWINPLYDPLFKKDKITVLRHNWLLIIWLLLHFYGMYSTSNQLYTWFPLFCFPVIQNWPNFV